MGGAQRDGGGRNLGAIWAGMSIAASAVLIQLFGAGWLLVVLGQVALFAGIGIFRAWRSK